MASTRQSRVSATDPRAKERCGHETCGCAATPEFGDHCSAYCANVDAHEPEDGACACGHAGCSKASRVAEGGDDVVTSLGRGPGAR